MNHQEYQRDSRTTRVCCPPERCNPHGRERFCLVMDPSRKVTVCCAVSEKTERGIYAWEPGGIQSMNSLKGNENSPVLLIVGERRFPSVLARRWTNETRYR